jgi:CDP-diacylglycerol--serine O-phosphatidyltransferase
VKGGIQDMVTKKRDPNRKPKKGVYILPNSITLCGMLAGFVSIMFSIEGNFVYAAWAIMIATVFDGLDGWIARMTNTQTRFGVELDSLSDLVAFGVAPAIMMYHWALFPFDRWGWAAAFLFIACGALRLARFNVQTETATSKAFKGMPIPAAAIIMCTIVVFHHNFSAAIPDENIVFPVITIILSLLMVSPFRYHGVKEVNFREKKPYWMLLILLMALFVLTVHTPIALFVFAMIYFIWGIVENIYLIIRNHKKESEQKLLPKAFDEKKHNAEAQ